MSEFFWFGLAISTTAAIPLLLRIRLLLYLYLGGLFFGSRAFASIGIYPAYIGDLLLLLLMLATAITAISNAGAHRFSKVGRNLGRVRCLMLLLAMLIFFAVMQGLVEGHAGALKLASTALACLTTGILLPHLATALGPDGEALRKVSLVAVPGFIFFTLLTSGEDVVAAGYGLAISVGACLTVAHSYSTRNRLTLPSLALCGIGFVCILTTTKRGPALVFLISVSITLLLAHVASRRESRAVIALTCLGSGGLIAAAPFILKLGTDIPIAGPLLNRVASMGTEGSESEANVSLRVAVWRYCIDAVLSDPLFGQGSAAPIPVVFRGVDFAEFEAGPHNSFIGLAFYAGLPALINFLALLAIAARMALRRRDTPVGAAQIGILVSIVLTCLTNVALEVPYIAGPVVLLLGWIVSDGVRGVGNTNDARSQQTVV